MNNLGLDGLDQLRGTLRTIENDAAKKAAKAGVSAGLQALVSAIRQEINGLGISGEAKAACRLLVGRRLMKVGADYVGKAGFAVGKPSAAKKLSAGLRHLGQRGVGISANDIHWLVLGTAMRTTQSGHRTGEGPALLAGVVGEAASGAVSQILTAAQVGISKVLATEAAKVMKG